jgi:glycosyltransferase involved in cell wall biosynthesis
MKPPTVLFILHWPPPVHGSSVVGLQIKQSELINSGFKCNYINLGTSKSINEIGKNGFVKIFRYFSIVFQLVKMLITQRPDLCYFALTVKGAAFYKDAFLIMLIKLFNVKLVYHFHNKGVLLKQNKFTYNLVYRFVFKNVDAILLSKFLYSDVQKYIPIDKIHICHNGIAPDNKSNQIEKKYKNQTVKILFLSNLIESKGVYVLLEACSILKQKNILFECDYIGGEGDIFAAQFESKVQMLGLSNEVKYLGKKYGEEKNIAFANADIFAFPTYYDNECFPLVLLEALQHGLPIVSTFEGGIQDIVDDGKMGFLVEQRNIQQFAAKLEILALDDELRSEMSKAGRIKFQKDFTLNKFEENLNEILHQIVN